MRGFGCVQAAFAHEALMDELADTVGIDRVEIRQHNGMREGDLNFTGQVIDSAAPVGELLQIVLRAPAAARARRGLGPALAARRRSNTTHGEGVVRGIGFAVAYKNVGFSEGFDDYSTARVRLEMTGGEAIGDGAHRGGGGRPGAVTVEQQIAARARGRRVVVEPNNTSVGSGGLDLGVPADLRDRGRGEGGLRGGPRRRPLAGRASLGATPGDLRLDGEKIVGPPARCSPGWPRCSATTPSRRPSSTGTGPPTRSTRRPGRATRTCSSPSPRTARWSTSTSSSGLVKVVALDTAQDVGKAINPDAVVGQIHGGSAQGMGLALMEEIVVTDGHVRNPSFTDYLIPTILDMPPMQVERARVRRPARALRRARGGGAADDLVRPGRRRRDPGRDRQAAAPGADPPGAHHRHLTRSTGSRANTAGRRAAPPGSEGPSGGRENFPAHPGSGPTGAG